MPNCDIFSSTQVPRLMFSETSSHNSSTARLSASTTTSRGADPAKHLDRIPGHVTSSPTPHNTADLAQKTCQNQNVRFINNYFNFSMVKKLTYNGYLSELDFRDRDFSW